jgi:uncharacterized protein YecE (DUF72 family)
MKDKLYIGMSGLVLPYKNKLAYPIEFEGHSRMSVYGKLFNSIEINSIFYKLPKTNTVTNWAQMVDNEFRFTFKLWKQITHSPSLSFKDEDIDSYFRVISGAGEKKGCILVQFPGSVKSALIGKVASLLSRLQIYDGTWRIAVEFRHHSWYNERTYDLLNDYNAAMVYHDKKGSQSPHPELRAEHIYVRFHGPDGDYKGSYDQGLLHEYAGYISDWRNAGKIVYVYFNNTMGHAVENSRALEQLLQQYDVDTSSQLY